jgi:hypothetical protein
MEEFEIEWTPEEVEIEEKYALIDVSPYTIDKICKKKFGHTNWARLTAVTPEEIAGNPGEIDIDHGVIYFKNAHMV